MLKTLKRLDFGFITRRCHLTGVAIALMLGLGSASVSAEDWVYTVRANDTLWHLCLKYTTQKGCWQKIGPYNGVDYPRSLAPGTRIRFPVAWLKAQPIGVELIYVAGEVRVRETSEGDQTTRIAALGDTLSMGNEIETGADSSASLRFADGAVMVLEENSHIQLDSLSQHGNTGMVDSRINLLRGAAKTKVPKREPRSQFRVSTPSAVAAVRGTDFRVSANGNDGAASMLGEVYEGNVDVDNSAADAVMVARGYGIKAEKGQPLMQPTALLPAPEWRDLNPSQALPITLTWHPLAGAQGYKISILEYSEEEKVIGSGSTTDNELTLPITENGCYKVRLSARDKLGLQGMPAQQNICAALAPSAVTVSANSSKKLTHIRWTAAEGAVAYQLEVSRSPSFDKLLRNETVAATELDLAGRLPGKFYVRVRPLAEYQVAGNYSEPVEVKTRDTALIMWVLGSLLTMLLL